MPVVPRPQTMSVMPSVSSGGGFANPLSVDAATLPGRQISQLGEAIQSAAHVAEVVGRAEKDRVEKERAEATVALDGTNRLQQMGFDLADPDKVFPRVNDWSKTDQALSEFDKGWDDISKTMSGGARAMFDASALDLRGGLAKTLARQDADRARAFHANVLATTVSQAAGALMAGTGGDDAGYAARARAALVAGGLGQGLSGEDLDRQTAFAFGRRVVEPVVTARLSQGDVAGARAFFDAHRDGMAGDDADSLDKRLAEAGQAWDTKTFVDGLWNRLGPKSFNDPIDLNAIENDLVVRHGGDEEALARARDEVFHRILGFTQARDETHAGYANFAIAKAKDGASPAQIAALPQFLALPRDRQQQLIDWHREQMTDRLTGFAPDQNLDRMAWQFAAYHDLSGSDALKAMSDAQVQALEPVLGEDLTKQALAQKMVAPLDRNDLAVVAQGVGLDPDPADTLSKAQLGVIRSRANAAVTSAGRSLTPPQKRDVALDAAASAVQGHPLFNGSRNSAAASAWPGGGGTAAATAGTTANSLQSGNEKATHDNTSYYQLGMEWATGVGPRHHQFHGGDPATEALRQHHWIKDVVKKVADGDFVVGRVVKHPFSLGGASGVGEYLTQYMSIPTNGVIGNLAVGYLGSYQMAYTVTGINDGVATIKFHVYNSSNMSSATHPPIFGYRPWWRHHVEPMLNDNFKTGPLSPTTQSFDWEEKVNLKRTHK